MHYELTDHEWTAIKPMLPNKAAWRSSGERRTGPEWHLLGPPIRSTLARSANGVWPIHHLLQPLR